MSQTVNCNNCQCQQEHNAHEQGSWAQYWPATVSALMLAAGLAADHFWQPAFFGEWVRLAWYVAAYLPVGLPVIKEGWEALRGGAFFTEYTLMVIATLGAFVVGDYAEGVGVMVFYAVGELFQHAAVSKARHNIRSLMEIRPTVATVLREGGYRQVAPQSVAVGELVQVKAGERVPLDGLLISQEGSFNTSALTGESVPRTIRQGETVLAGMVNLDRVVEISVTQPYEDSSLARILEMTQHAVERKAKPELMIRRFARVYTPIVFAMAVALTLLPYFFVSDYVFGDWLYRALIFLVVSCPCALVISIPLGYFGGIGAASRHGILFKGANYLDVMARVNTVVMDKTGTLTEGVFSVQQVNAVGNAEKFIRTIAALEASSTHPIAKAVTLYAAQAHDAPAATSVEEIPGHGLRGIVAGEQVLAGNTKLLQINGVDYDITLDKIAQSVVACAIAGQYAGYIVVGDRVKADAAHAVDDMQRNGVTLTMVLSGDKDAITQQTAAQAGVDRAYGNLLPQDKVRHVEELRSEPGRVVAFVGDGINDAPVLAASDIGIAMGAMGSHVAIETADVVIQTDQPSRIATAMKIGRATRRIVIQNIVMAMGVKVIVMAMGAAGVATMWEAVFADVGVALLAILNAVRIQRMDF